MRNTGLEDAQAGNRIARRNKFDIKKHLNESESGELQSWLKAQHSENEDHDIWSHHFMGNRWGNGGNSGRLYFWGATTAMKLKDAYSLEEKL